MATRSNIELYDGWKPDNGKTAWRQGAVLYHHWDGYPSWMGPRLEELLKQVKAALDQAGYPYWWDSDRVGALMVKLSADEDEMKKGVPAFQTCFKHHADIEYLWRVFLGPKEGVYDIECFSIAYDWDKDIIKHLEKVDWRKEVERQQRR